MKKQKENLTKQEGDLVQPNVSVSVFQNRPIKFYSDLHKAFIPDLNRCPICGEIFCIGASGNIYCATDKCELETIGKLNKKAMKLYFGKYER
jgi:hypothetical protein